MTNITFIISSLANKAPVKVLLNIVTYLDFNRFNVTIITLKKEPEDSLLVFFKTFPVSIVQLEKRNPYNILQIFLKLKEFLKNNPQDIIHSHCFRSLILSYLFRNKYSWIHTVHNNPTNFTKTNGMIEGFFLEKITIYLLRNCSKPISCSNSVKEDIFKKYKLNFLMIRNGIKTNSNIENKNLKNELGLRSSFKYFISVGNFSESKNFKFLINSFKNNSIKGCKLILLGNGTEYEAIKKDSDEHIILPGFKKNVHDYLNICDYYISASLTEGMPLSVLEATSAGLPLILSDIPSHQEIISVGREKLFGFLFKNNCEEDLKLKIDKLLKQDYTNLSNNSKLLFEKSFSAKSMSLNYQNVFINQSRC